MKNKNQDKEIDFLLDELTHLFDDGETQWNFSENKQMMVDLLTALCNPEFSNLLTNSDRFKKEVSHFLNRFYIFCDALGQNQQVYEVLQSHFAKNYLENHQ